MNYDTWKSIEINNIKAMLINNIRLDYFQYNRVKLKYHRNKARLELVDFSQTIRQLEWSFSSENIVHVTLWPHILQCQLLSREKKKKKPH